MRNDDLDRDRVRPEFVTAMYEDMHWLGLQWDEGPDVGRPHTRRTPKASAWHITAKPSKKLKAAGLVFPATVREKRIVGSRCPSRR
jgi:glutamyl-tRNA synthetase